MSDYIAIRPFSSLRHNGLEHRGDRIPGDSFTERTAKSLMKKGLIQPVRSHREKVKKLEKVRVVHEAGPYFLIMRGDDQLDRVYTKKKAEERADELNQTQNTG